MSGLTSNSTPKTDDHGRGFHVRGVGAGPEVLDAAAKALGLSTEDLLKKLSDGKTTIADVAKAQNVDVQKVIELSKDPAQRRNAEELLKDFHRLGVTR